MPRPFARAIVGHEVWTVRQLRWNGLSNGDLLRRAVADRFDVLITVDRNLEYQQHVAAIGLGFVVLIARSNRTDDLVPLAPAVLTAIEALRSGQVVRVGAN